MKRIIQYLIISVFLSLSALVYAQSYSGLEKIPLENGLKKVKNGQYYGVENAEGRILVPVEFADYAFVDGIAILTKNDGTVHGYIKDDGEVHMYDQVYEYHSQYPFYWNGYLPVRKISKQISSTEEEKNGRWMFIDESGNPIFNPKYNLKKVKVNLRRPYYFYKVSTFSDGYAVVTTIDNQIIHIDKKGNTSFILPKEEVCYFRSSVHKGECVMLTSRGLRVFQENPSTGEAMVKQTLIDGLGNLVDKTLDSLCFKEATLHLDLWGRATRFVTKEGESVYFIGEPPVDKTPPPPPPTPVFDLFKDVDVHPRNTVATASEKGYAAYAVTIANTSEVVSDSLTVTIKSSGMRDKVEEMVLNPGEEKKMTFYLPAKFSEAKQTRNVIVIVANQKGNIETPYKVTANRAPVKL